MGITLFNNWVTSKEFHLIELSYQSFENPAQIGFTICLLGIGIVIVINSL